MATHILKRVDIQLLAGKLEEHATSPLVRDMPRFRSDTLLAAGVIRYVVAIGWPIVPITIEIRNGD